MSHSESGRGRFISLAFLGALACVGCAGALAAQGGPPNTDWYGFWQFKDFHAGVMKAGIIPFTPPYEAKIEEINRIAAAQGDVPTVSKICQPFGVPFAMEGFSEIFFAPDHATLIMGSSIRYIWTDGRAHTPEDQLFESLNGEAIGKWDGDTFVIDTIGLQPNEIVLGVPVPHMHVIERLHLTDSNSMEITSIITSPDGLKSPWTYVRHFGRSEDGPARFGGGAGGDCGHDRSVDRKTGKQGFDLTPPKGGFVPPGVKE